MGGSRGGGTGGPDPSPEKSQKYSFFSNTGPDPLNNQKATKPAFNVGPSSARWCFAGGLMMAHLSWYLDPLSPHQLKEKKKNLSNLDPL